MDKLKSNLKGEIIDKKQPSASASAAGLETCFTCFRKADDCVRIIEGDAVNEPNRAAIFAQHFWFTRDEYYNRTICKSCWSSIDDFHRFYCQVEKHHPQPEPTRIKVERLEDVYEMEIEPLLNAASPGLSEDDLESKKFVEVQKKFKCDACPRSFEEAKLLQSHLVWHLVTKEKNLHCAICDQYFFAPKKLDEHMRLHHVPNVITTKPEKVVTMSDVESEPEEETNPTQFPCGLCPKVFPSDKLRQSHILWHEVIKERNHHCKRCNQYFDTMESLETHRKSHRNTKGPTKPEEKPPKPVEKPKKDLSKPKQQIKSTLKEIAEQEKLILRFTKFRCSKCDHEAPTFLDLKHHGESEHGCTTTPIPVICCGKSFNGRLRLYYHCLTHIDPNHFKCESCGKVFKERKSLQGHRLAVHTPASERAFKCEVCGASFAQEHRLKQHEGNHSKRLRILIGRSTGSGTDSDSDMPLAEFKELLETKKRNADPAAMSNLNEIWEEKKRKLADLVSCARDQMACYYCHEENPELKVKFSTFLSLKQHSREKHGKSPALYCSMCDRRFLSEEAFVADYAKHTDRRDQLIECVECKLLFESEEVYKKHMLFSHTKEEQKLFSCNLCPKAFPLEDLLKSHLNWHKEIQQKNFHCPECDLYFLSAAKLKEHTDSCPGAAETPAVSEPSAAEPSRFRKFSTPEEIADQEKLIQKYVTLECARCKHVAETFAKYRRHSKKEHALSGFGVFCCAKRYTTRFTLYEHCLKHDDPERFKCKTCGKQCGNNYTLKRHMWTIHTPLADRPFKCDVCGDAFLKDFQLETHMNFHVSKEQKKFECQECVRVFSYKYFLKKHMETMHGQSDV